VDFTHFVGFSGIKKNAFADGGFSGVDVRHDSDVPQFC
jgi:hypothetical protein